MEMKRGPAVLAAIFWLASSAGFGAQRAGDTGAFSQNILSGYVSTLRHGNPGANLQSLKTFIELAQKFGLVEPHNPLVGALRFNEFNHDQLGIIAAMNLPQDFPRRVFWASDEEKGDPTPALRRLLMDINFRRFQADGILTEQVKDRVDLLLGQARDPEKIRQTILSLHELLEGTEDWEILSSGLMALRQQMAASIKSLEVMRQNQRIDPLDSSGSVAEDPARVVSPTPAWNALTPGQSLSVKKKIWSMYRLARRNSNPTVPLAIAPSADMDAIRETFARHLLQRLVAVYGPEETHLDNVIVLIAERQKISNSAWKKFLRLVGAPNIIVIPFAGEQINKDVLEMQLPGPENNRTRDEIEFQASAIFETMPPIVRYDVVEEIKAKLSAAGLKGYKVRVVANAYSTWKVVVDASSSEAARVEEIVGKAISPYGVPMPVEVAKPEAL